MMVFYQDDPGYRLKFLQLLRYAASGSEGLVSQGDLGLLGFRSADELALLLNVVYVYTNKTEITLFSTCLRGL